MNGWEEHDKGVKKNGVPDEEILVNGGWVRANETSRQLLQGQKSNDAAARNLACIGAVCGGW